MQIHSLTLRKAHEFLAVCNNCYQIYEYIFKVYRFKVNLDCTKQYFAALIKKYIDNLDKPENEKTFELSTKNQSQQKLFSQKPSKQTLNIPKNTKFTEQKMISQKLKSFKQIFSKHEQNWLNFNLQQNKFNLTVNNIPKSDSRIISTTKNANDKQVQFYFTKNNENSKKKLRIQNQLKACKSYNDVQITSQQTVSEKYKKIVQDRFIESAQNRNYEKLGKQANGLFKQLNQIHKQFNI